MQPPKTRNVRRKVDLSSIPVHELKKHKLSCPKGELDLVFSNSDGSILDPDNMVHCGFLPALREEKIRMVRFHDLRHTNASLRIEQGQNLVYVSKQIGQSNVSTILNVYSHLLKEVHAELAQKLDVILGFAEHPGSSSEGVRRLLEDGPPRYQRKRGCR
jgi:integrase